MIYFLIILCLIVVFLVGIYNGLVRNQQQVQEAWSTIDTQLKRRYDLIPNLMETVRGYMQHEQKTLEAVVQARANAMSVAKTDVAKKQANENALSNALKSVFALSENYPDLKANENFLALQQELSDTETKIQAARQFYNTIVSSFNTKVKSFPSNLVANMFQFKEAHFFELGEAEREAVQKAPEVKF